MVTKAHISKIKKYCSFNNKNLVGILFMVPCLVFLILIAIYPVLFATKMSFYNWKLISPDKIVEFVGMKNYISALTNYRFWNSIKVTALFAIMTIPIEFVLGISIALLLDRNFKGKLIARSLFILPMVVCPLSAGILFRLMYHFQYGIINQILNLFHIAPKMWLASSSMALIAVVICELWQSIPFVTLITLAGLEMLPRDPFEAAIVDGVNSVQKFFYITLPLLSKLLVLAFIIRAIDVIRIFDSIYAMTKGGPGISTETFGLYIYKEGFKFFNTSYASAVSLIVLLIVGGLIVSLNNILREEKGTVL